MRQMKFFIRFVDNLNDWQGKIFSFLVYVVMGVLVYEVVMRYVFDAPTLWAHETSGFFYGAHLIFGGAFALRWGAHVSVEVIYNRFAPRTRAIVDLISWTLFYTFCGVLLWQTGVLGWISVGKLEYSPSVWGPPLWPLKLTIPVAVALLLLQGLTKTIKDVYTAITGRELVVEVGIKAATK